MCLRACGHAVLAVTQLINWKEPSQVTLTPIPRCTYPGQGVRDAHAVLWLRTRGKHWQLASNGASGHRSLAHSGGTRWPHHANHVAHNGGSARHRVCLRCRPRACGVVWHSNTRRRAQGCRTHHGCGSSGAGSEAPHWPFLGTHLQGAPPGARPHTPSRALPSVGLRRPPTMPWENPHLMHSMLRRQGEAMQEPLCSSPLCMASPAALLAACGICLLAPLPQPTTPTQSPSPKSLLP